MPISVLEYLTDESFMKISSNLMGSNGEQHSSPPRLKNHSCFSKVYFWTTQNLHLCRSKVILKGLKSSMQSNALAPSRPKLRLYMNILFYILYAP